jgi:CheY-like chemotaxis protein
MLFCFPYGVLMHMPRPVLDGLAATQEIRALEDAEHTARRVPIVAVSGNARSEWADRARAAGMDGFVRKPYGRAELEAVVNTWRERDRAA